MTDAGFRRCANCGYPDFTRHPVLGQLYRRVPRLGRVTTAQLAKFFDISVQNAANRLRTLEAAGLVTSASVRRKDGRLTKEYSRAST